MAATLGGTPGSGGAQFYHVTIRRMTRVYSVADLESAAVAMVEIHNSVTHSLTTCTESELGGVASLDSDLLLPCRPRKPRPQ